MIYKAYTVNNKGQELHLQEIEAKPLEHMDCRIRVETCGICHSDIHMIDNNWKISKYPFVPGHEIVGRVVEIGKSVTHINLGDRVGVGWQSGACFSCDDCMAGNENLCDSNLGTIVGRDGGFAEHVKVDSRFAFKIPNSLESALASPLLCGGITVFSALKHAGMTYGGRIGVIGIGGLGHMAILFAKKLGNMVTAFTTSPDKAKFAESLGADEVVVKPGFKSKIKKKMNIIINTTHSDLDWSYYIHQLDSDGVLTFVGVPPTPMSLPVGSLLGKRKRVMASPIGGRKDIYEMLNLASEYKIHPIIEKYPISKINEAIQDVRENKVKYRAVLEL